MRDGGSSPRGSDVHPSDRLAVAPIQVRGNAGTACAWFGSLIRESGRHDRIQGLVVQVSRVGPGQDLVEAGVGGRPHDELAAPDPDGPDQGTRGDQPLFREAVEPAAVEVDQARRPQAASTPGRAGRPGDRAAGSNARPRSPRASGGSRKTRLASGSLAARGGSPAPPPGAAGGKSARRNFRPRSIDCWKARQRLSPRQHTARSPISPPEGMNTSAISRNRPKASNRSGQASVLMTPPRSRRGDA